MLQQEDGGDGMYGTILGHRSDDQDGRSYKIRVTETGYTKGCVRPHQSQ